MNWVLMLSSQQNATAINELLNPSNASVFDLLRDASTQPMRVAEAQVLGRLLLYEPTETVSDGAAQAASRGFFDAEDAPPWDTWFWLKESTIFCWVPESLISDAQAGIDANPVDCIRWADGQNYQY